MINSSIIFIGLDTHKEFVEVAYVEDDRNAKVTHLGRVPSSKLSIKKMGYTDLMVDGAPLPHQPDTIIRWLIDRLRS
ncbi:hypothetical protein [Neptunomonas phycophila]|uniref:hypothetical protein n=1 Tax=Neptunomonas phycophila TaxID=1572645 RepID=UPI0035177DB8